MAESILACSACLRRAMQVLPRQRIALDRMAVQQALLARPFPRPAHQFASSAPSPIAKTEVKAELLDDAQAGDSSIAKKKEREKLERAVKKQLSYAQDEFKIAQAVENALKRDRYDEALLLTQMASKDRQVVVAWNYLINYNFEKQQLRAAIKLYNDMKKRAQLPNVQTYTIIFRGCAKSQHPKLAVAEALKHYNILLKDSRLEPNSIHMNAVINVCGRAHDLDSMFSVLDTINDTTRVPTAFTYATIINCLRHTAMEDVKDLDPEQKAANLSKMVYRAKAVWEEVIQKWRKGQLVVDETLVCAMGRVLFASPNREDKKEIFELLHQTMNLPNFLKENESTPEAESTSVTTSKKGLLYAEPGRNTLSLVLNVVSSARLTTAGIKYWNVLVREHGIIPDNDNWVRMFAMLRIAKASGHASEIIELVPDEYINTLHYRMAMEACVRDNINPNAIKNATRVLDSMVARLKVPDPHTLRLYLRVALVSHYAHRLKSQDGDTTGAKRAYGQQIAAALSKLREPYHALHTFYFKTFVPQDATQRATNYNARREVIALARIMYSSFSKVIEERMLPDSDIRTLRPVGAALNRQIQRFFADREDREPNLNPGKTRDAKADMSEYTYHPAGDFVWDTSKTDEPVSKRADERRGGGGRFERRSGGRGGERRERRDRGGERRRLTDEESYINRSRGSRAGSDAFSSDLKW